MWCWHPCRTCVVHHSGVIGEAATAELISLIESFGWQAIRLVFHSRMASHLGRVSSASVNERLPGIMLAHFRA